jgi:hypothetical protein
VGVRYTINYVSCWFNYQRRQSKRTRVERGWINFWIVEFEWTKVYFRKSVLLLFSPLLIIFSHFIFSWLIWEYSHFPILFCSVSMLLACANQQDNLLKHLLSYLQNKFLSSTNSSKVRLFFFVSVNISLNSDWKLPSIRFNQDPSLQDNKSQLLQEEKRSVGKLLEHIYLSDPQLILSVLRDSSLFSAIGASRKNRDTSEVCFENLWALSMQ